MYEDYLQRESVLWGDLAGIWQERLTGRDREEEKSTKALYNRESLRPQAYTWERETDANTPWSDRRNSRRTAEKQDREGERQAVLQEKRNWFKITSRGKWPTFNYDAYRKPTENERKMGGSSEDRKLNDNNDPDYTWYSVLVHSDM